MTRDTDAQYVQDEIRYERVSIAKWRRDACAHCTMPTYDDGRPMCEPENAYGNRVHECDVYDRITQSKNRIADFLGY